MQHSMLRMNLFQRLTRQWDTLHPYNAAQVMRLRQAPAADLLNSTWNDTLITLGLGRVEVRGHGYRHIPSALPVMHLSADTDPEIFISEQMNVPFDLTSEGPFRAFALPQRTGCCLGIVYHHWLADSVSIRVLMREWLLRILNSPARTTPLPPLESPSSLSGGIVQMPFSIASLIQWRNRGVLVRRLPAESLDDLTVKHRLLSLPDGVADDLHRAARSHRVKVTDLLLCSIAQVCNRHLPTLNERRPDLAIGNIRDLRGRQHNFDPDAFGSSLALSTMICPRQALEDRKALLQLIAQENTYNRTPAAFHARNLDMRVALAAAHVLKPHRMLSFYRKRVPVSAGLSNVNLTDTPIAAFHPQHISGYYRVSPAGPMLPLVITPTTLNQQLTISLTWRANLFTQTTINAFSEDLVRDLQLWCVGRERTLAREPAA